MKKYLRPASMALLTFFSETSIAAEDQAERFKMAVDWMKTACVSGEHIDIKADGEGGLKLFKAGAEGGFSFSKTEIKGVITNANDQIRAEENSEIRQCMQPYIQTILGIIATPIVKKDQQESLPVNQWIPVDIPMPILDGNPLITLTKVYEFNRNEVIDLSIEIPYRSPYRLKLWQSSNSSLKNSDTFKYRDTIYKIVADQIDLQGQRAKVSLMNYKKIR